MIKILKQRRFTKSIIKFYTRYLPAILTDNYYTKKLMALIYYRNGFKNFDMYFKEKAPYMTDEELIEAYKSSPEGWHDWSETDCIPKVINWIYSNIQDTDKIIDVGGGHGGLWRDYAYPQNVTILDIIDHSSSYLYRNFTYINALAHQTKLNDKEFDVAVCAHVLEHVIYFTKTLKELIRISKKQLIVVPKQKFERFTLDYHVNFFPSKEQFLLRLIDSSIDVSKVKLFDMDNEICAIIE